MKYNIQGVHRDTGEDIALDLEADSESDALKLANRMGIMPERVTLCTPPVMSRQREEAADDPVATDGDRHVSHTRAIYTSLAVAGLAVFISVVAVKGCRDRSNERAWQQQQAEVRQSRRESKALTDRRAADQKATKDAKRAADKREQTARAERSRQREKLIWEIYRIERSITTDEFRVDSLARVDQVNRDFGLRRGGSNNEDIETIRRRIEDARRRLRECKRQLDQTPR